MWFDSGTTHVSVLARRAGLTDPADLYLEGTDQHRGWFQSSLLTACAIDGRAPYKQLLTHGFVIDEHGRKMSKSMGNGIAPQEVSGQLGAEILRLWVASTDYSGELSLSQEILKRVVEMYRRIRNTLRFLLANVSDFDPGRDMVAVERWVELDRYAVAMTREMQDAVMHDYGRYEFHFAMQKLHASAPSSWARSISTSSRIVCIPAAWRARRAAPLRARYGISRTACCACSRRC